MTRQRRETPVEQWVLDREVRPTSAIEALMFHSDDFDPRTEGLLDLFEDLLTEEEKWVVDAIVFNGRSYRTVARQMNCSVGNVWNICRRALDKLKGALEDG